MFVSRFLHAFFVLRRSIALQADQTASATAFLAESDAFVHSAAEAQHQRVQQRLRNRREHVQRMRTLSDGDSLFARAAQATQG